MHSLVAFLLTILTLCSTACAGVYLPPGVNVPALRQAGQATVSANARVFAPQLGAHALAAVAITDQLRIAGSVSGAFDRDRRRGIYGEALVGAEPMVTRRVQLGFLGGVGYGDVAARHSSCRDVDMCISTAPGGAAEQVRAHYMRYSVQAHVTFHAPMVGHAGGGLRLSLLNMHVDEVEERLVRARGLPVALEPFVFGRAGWPFLQGEVQLRYTGIMNSPRVSGERVVVSDHFTYVIGLRFVFGRGITRRWTREHQQR